MKRYPERPGLGFASKSAPQSFQPAKTSSSIFGLISQVNKGVPEPVKKIEETPLSVNAAKDAAKDAAKIIAEKLAVQKTVQKSQHFQEKNIQFLTAKANVERLFQGGSIAQQPTEKPRVITQTTSNIFKVPEAKTTSSDKGSSRPGLGFEPDKKFVPKQVGLGRNIFTPEENVTKEGKYSLVPYGYDDKKDSESSSSKRQDSESSSTSRRQDSGSSSTSRRQDSESSSSSKRQYSENNSTSRRPKSDSSSRGERRFTEEGRRSRESEKSSSRKRESKRKEEKADKSSDTLHEDYLKYGFGKEESSRNESDVHRYTNETKSKEVARDDRGYVQNQQNVNYSQYALHTQGPIDFIDSNQFVGAPPGQPVFISALPVNVPMGFGVPLESVNLDRPTDDYYGDREGFHTSQFPNDQYPLRDEYRNYDDMPDSSAFNDYEYDRHYRDDSYGQSPYRDDRYSDDRFLDNFSDRLSRDGDYGYEPRWSDRRSQSLSPDRYNPHDVWDNERDFSPRGSRRRSLSIDRDSAWVNINLDDRRRLAMLEEERGFAAPRERHRSRDRGGSLDRDRSRRYSRSRSRGRDRRKGSRERRGSSGRRTRQDSKERSKLTEVKAAEDAFEMGHRHYLEGKELKWLELKTKFNLTEVDKAMHPLFINREKGGYLCKDCNVTCMDSGEYGIHLYSENHLRIVQLKAQQMLMKEMSGEKIDPKPEPKKAERKLSQSDRKADDKPRSRSSHKARSNDKSKHTEGSRDRAQRSGSKGRRPKSRSPVRRPRTRSPVRRPRTRSPVRPPRTRSPVRRPKSRSPIRRPRSRSPIRRPKSPVRATKTAKSLDKKMAPNQEDGPKGSAESLPKKPKGPLRFENIQSTSLQVFWGKPDNPTNESYLVEYSVVAATMEIWLPLGTTTEKYFIVRELKPNTAYKFRVKSVKGDLESVPLLSYRVVTKPAPPAGKSADTVDLTKDTDESVKEHTKEKVQDAKIRVESMKKDKKAEDSEKKEKEDEEKEKNKKQEQQTEPHVVLYEKLKGTENIPHLGIEYLKEKRDFNPLTVPKYICKLCNMSMFGAHSVMQHCRGFSHMVKYFEKHSPEIVTKLMLVSSKRDRRILAFQHALLIQYEKGWGAIELLQMKNRADHGGKAKWFPAVQVPPPEFKWTFDEKPTAEAVEKAVEDVLIGQESVQFTLQNEIIKRFDRLLQDAEVEKIKNGEKISPVLGLEYIKEMLHPMMNELPRYQCNLCKSNCSQPNILKHIWGKNHKLKYLKTKRPAIHEEVMNIKGKKEQNEAIDGYSHSIEEEVGRQKVVVIKARNSRLWDWAKALQEKAEREKAEQEAAAVVAKESEKPKGFKFDVKAKEQPTTNIQPTNILEKSPVKKVEEDWNKIIDNIHERIRNQSIIKSTRPPKFNSTYSTFFKKFPVIGKTIIMNCTWPPKFNSTYSTFFKKFPVKGLQWVTEFQKPDKNEEPWYICYLCQAKLEWKSILDHVTSVNHRVNYMQKGYLNMHKLLMRTTKNNKGMMKLKVEEYSAKIMKAEEEHKVEVMLELNFTKSLLATVKEKEKDKTHGTAPATSISNITPSTTTKRPRITAEETAFSTGFSSLIEKKSDTASDLQQPTFSTSQEESLYKAQLEAQAKLASDAQAKLSSQMETEKSPAETALNTSQLDAQTKLNNQQAVNTDLLQAQLQAQEELAKQKIQPALVSNVSAEVSNVSDSGFSRGFSAQQILPGMPIPQQQNKSLSTNVPQFSVPQQQNIPISTAVPQFSVPQQQSIPINTAVPQFSVPQQQNIPISTAIPQFSVPQQQSMSINTAVPQFSVPQQQNIPISTAIPQFSVPQQQSMPINTAVPQFSVPQPQNMSLSTAVPRFSVPQQQNIPTSTAVPQFSVPQQQSMPISTAVPQFPIPQQQSMPINTAVPQFSVPQPQLSGVPIQTPVQQFNQTPTPSGVSTITQPPVTPASLPTSQHQFGLRKPNTGVGIRGVRPRMNRPTLNRPPLNRPTLNRPARPRGPRPRNPRYTWRAPGLQSGGTGASLSTSGINSNVVSSTTYKNSVPRGQQGLDKSTVVRSDTDKKSNENRNEFDKGMGKQFKLDRQEGNQNQDSHLPNRDSYTPGEKRKYFSQRSQDFQKRFRRSLSPRRQPGSRSPGNFDDSMAHEDEYGSERSRTWQRSRGISAERDNRASGNKSSYTEFDRVPEDGERIVRLLSPRSQRDRNRNDSHGNMEHMSDFEERYHRQAEHDVDEYVSDHEDDTDYGDLESMESQMLQADLELGAINHGRPDWDRDSRKGERYGENSHKSRDQGRRSRSPYQRRHYDRERDYTKTSESAERFADNRSREHGRRSRSPHQRREFDHRRSEREDRGRSNERYSDHGRERYMDEGEVGGRGSPTQADLQALLAEVSSKMMMMPDEDRQLMEEEFKRNFPQVSLPHGLDSDNQEEPGFSHQPERPGRGRGRAGARGRGFRGGRPPRGRGFQGRGRGR